MTDPAARNAKLAHLDALADTESKWRRAVKGMAEARGLALDMGNVERALQEIYAQVEEAKR